MDKDNSVYTVLSLFGILALVISCFAVLNIKVVISDLEDVNFISLQNGQIMIYDSISQKWKNGVILATGNLSSLNDVFIADIVNGEVLTYNSTSQKWENLIIPVNNLTNLQDVSFNNVIDGQILRYDSPSGKWKNNQNNVALSSSEPILKYAGLLWYNLTSQKMTVRSVDNTTWLDLYVYNALTWDGYLFSDWLNQAVKTSSSPTFSNLVINNNITIGGYIDGIDLSANINQAVKTTSNPIFGNMTLSGNNPRITISGSDYSTKIILWSIDGFSGYVHMISSLAGKMEFQVQYDAGFSFARSTGAYDTTPVNLVTIDSVGILRAVGYKSGDGTNGVTQDVIVLTALPSTFITMHFKNGLFVGTT